MRLTAMDWVKLRAAFETGTGTTELARQYGVTRSAIHKRSKREKWKPCGALREEAIQQAQANIEKQLSLTYKEEAAAANRTHLKLMKAVQSLSAQMLRKVESNINNPAEKQRIKEDVSALAALAQAIKMTIDAERTIYRLERLDLYEEGKEKDSFDKFCEQLAELREEHLRKSEN